MKTAFFGNALGLGLVSLSLASASFAQNMVKTVPGGGGATTVYRQTQPDGSVVYSDKPTKGAKIDHTITVDPVIKGNAWTASSGGKPAGSEQSESTSVKRVNTPPFPRRKTYDEANSDVIRAEMLLEDAQKRQQAGVEPLPGERTGNVNGTSRLNEIYQARQIQLAKEVADAEAALKRAVTLRDALPGAR